MSVFDNKVSDADLRSVISVEKETRSNQYIATCPWCGKESHFYINKTTQRWDCKKCGESGGIYKLLKHLDKTYLLGASTIKVENHIKSIREIEDSESAAETEDTKELPTIKMPAGYKVFRCVSPYLKDRGITMEDVRHWGFGETRIVSRYIGYVLIPIIENKEVKGFIGRYASRRVPDHKLRYSNSLGTDFASLLFGYDDIVSGETETVIITEGLFDAIAVTKRLNLFDDNLIRAVCTFGKKISKEQITKLLTKGIKNVILLYDYDALSEIKRYSFVLNEYFETQVAVALGKKDIDECTFEEVVEVFQNLRSVQDFNVDIAGKIKR